MGLYNKDLSSKQYNKGIETTNHILCKRRLLITIYKYETKGPIQTSTNRDQEYNVGLGIMKRGENAMSS